MTTGQRVQVRIVDVAREAGVSAQTVSNVINERDGFTEATRQRVLAAVERTGYRPNRAARILRTRRSSQLGIHLPASHLSVQNPFSVCFLSEVVDAADQVGHQVVVFTSPIEAATSGLVSAGVDGVILYSVDPHDPRPQALAAAGVPFAVFGRTEAHLPQSWVDVDNAAAMVDVVEHLLTRGCRRFAYVGYDEPEYWNVERLAGVRRSLASHGLEIPDRWLLGVTLETVKAQVEERLMGDEHPDAVICGSDSLAVVVHRAAQRAGLEVGKDLAVTGFDAIPNAFDVEPSLTSVQLPLERAAREVIRLVLRQIEGDLPPEQGMILPTRLALGGSA